MLSLFDRFLFVFDSSTQFGMADFSLVGDDPKFPKVVFSKEIELICFPLWNDLLIANARDDDHARRQHVNSCKTFKQVRKGTQAGHSGAAEEQN